MGVAVGNCSFFAFNLLHIVPFFPLFHHSVWSLVNQIEFVEPVYCLRYLDCTGDGMNELVVVTLHGVHVLQVCVCECDCVTVCMYACMHVCMYV